MARYRKIDTRTWNDQKFNELTDEGKLVFFQLLTHPHMTPIGAMRATIAGLASELRWSHEKFEGALSEAMQRNMVRYDHVAGMIWLPNFLKYNHPESPNVVRSWGNYLDYLPECDLKNEMIDCIRTCISGCSDSYQQALSEAFGIAFPKGFANQEQEQEQEQEKESSSGKPDDHAVSSSKNQERMEAISVLEFLNEKTGRAYRPVDINLKLIVARFKSGATVMDCRQVIAKKTREWKNDPKMSEYLRPATLFNATKFEQYMGELVLPKHEEGIR